MVWRYTLINDRACELKGVAFGRRRDVMERLQRDGCFIVDLDVDVGSTCQSILGGRAVPSGELSLFFKDLGHMLQAGLTISHILDTFRESISSPGIRGVSAQMKESLVTGKSLAQAMEEAAIFPKLALNAVRSGERSGQLPLSCDLLAEYYQLIAVLKGKIFHALAYPCTVFMLLCVALVYVAQSVVPQLASFLPPEDMEGGITRFMLQVSHMVSQGWGIVLCGAGIVVVLFIILSIRYRRKWDVLWGYIPWVGAIYKDMDIALCFFDVFILLKSGIPLDAALREAAAAQETLARTKLELCATHLMSGHTFAQALAQSDYFPKLLVDTIRIGEEIGAYDDYCGRVFRFYHRSFETRLDMLVALVQPVLLGLCALWLMVFALAFLKPVYANLTHIGVLKL